MCVNVTGLVAYLCLGIPTGFASGFPSGFPSGFTFGFEVDFAVLEVVFLDLEFLAFFFSLRHDV